MTAVAMLVLAGVTRANDPLPSGVRMPNVRGPLHSAANWWARFGEPVNQEAIDAAPVKAMPIAAAGWHEGFGYVYGPGACDYTPACTDWQWKDYSSTPWRCYPLHDRWGHGRCGHCGGCGDCGHGKCGHGGCGRGKCGCGKAAHCGCAAPAPTCEAKVPTCEAVPACGCDVATECCGKRHFHWHWKGLSFWNRHCGCDTCAPSCGCDAPVVDGKAIQSPILDEAPPKPIAEEKAAALGKIKPTLAWPFGQVR
jgi:hypothetical protein